MLVETILRVDQYYRKYLLDLIDKTLPEKRTGLDFDNQLRDISFILPFAQEIQEKKAIITTKYNVIKHPALDIALYGRENKNAPILSAAAGKVIFSGRSKGYGKYIKIDHGFGYISLYAHLSKIFVKNGQQVKLGQTLGLMGRTGRVVRVKAKGGDGTHLHFAVFKNGKPINPLNMDSNFITANKIPLWNEDINLFLRYQILVRKFAEK